MMTTQALRGSPYGSGPAPGNEAWRPWQDAHPGNAESVSKHVTSREQQVLALVAEGYSNKLIATRLAISERTVKSHMTNIMGKLWASDRTHAVVTALRLGLLDL